MTQHEYSEPGGRSRLTDPPDRRDGVGYVINPEVAFAVDVALAAGRPLLLRGEPGSGKSSLAAYVARQRGWRYYEHVVTSRTSARDLLWSFDAVRRLGDAQVRAAGEALNDAEYVEPGVLWWAFDRESAARRGSARSTQPAMDPHSGNINHPSDSAVVLIDEIDKADPDLPNGILVPLGSAEFYVPETRTVVRRRPSVDGQEARLLIVITTNEERELPEAFLRRCVVTWLPGPTEEHLLAVAREHLKAAGVTPSPDDDTLATRLAAQLMNCRKDAAHLGLRPPSTAEFLDAFRTLRQLGIGTDDERWERIRDLTLVKPRQPPDH